MILPYFRKKKKKKNNQKQKRELNEWKANDANAQKESEII